MINRQRPTANSQRPTAKVILLLALTFLMASCEKVIDFDPGDISPKIVMISKPVNDSTVTVYLGYSRFFLDNSNFKTEVEDATVILEVNGTPYPTTGEESSIYGPKCYSFAVRPQPGDSLRLSAEVPGYKSVVTAETTIPRLPQIEITDCMIDTSNGYSYDDYYYSGEIAYRMRFKVKSNSNDEYFLVRILMADHEVYGDTVNIRWDTADLNEYWFYVNDPIVNTSDITTFIDMDDGAFSGDEMYFSSEMFQNGEHEFTAEFQDWGGHYSALDVSKRPLYLEVRSLTRDLYLYLVTTEHQSEADVYFSEPVQVHCNVSGGIGIFGGSCSTRFRVSNSRFEHFYNSSYKKR